MSIDVRQPRSVAEVMVAIDVLDRIFGPHEGWNAVRESSIASYRADPALVAIALDEIRAVGVVGTDGTGTITILGVDAAYRGRGIARRLLGAAENTLRQRGARSVGLGSVDGAAGFYRRCGYVPQLLVQFRPDAPSPQRIVRDLLSGPLRDYPVSRTEFDGSPQLWVQVDDVDFVVKARVEAAGPGTVAQYIMSKQL